MQRAGLGVGDDGGDALPDADAEGGEADLAAWAERVRAQPWGEAFVFFKHEDAGAAPRLATEFLALAERAERRRGPRSCRR